MIGLGFAIVGGALLIQQAVRTDDPGLVAATWIYVAGLIIVFALSMAYNFASASQRGLLRRFDHAGIFLMIAGTYTPFTTQALQGGWAWGMTIAVWTIAIIGIAGKLFGFAIGKLFWVGVYVLMGWLVVIAIYPLWKQIGWTPLIWLASGGLLYMVGVAFYVNKSFKLRRPVWHAHVVAAAVAQWIAVLTGVVAR